MLTRRVEGELRARKRQRHEKERELLQMEKLEEGEKSVVTVGDERNERDEWAKEQANDGMGRRSAKKLAWKLEKEVRNRSGEKNS